MEEQDNTTQEKEPLTEAQTEQTEHTTEESDNQETKSEKSPLELAQEEALELKNKHMRLYAEFENFRRRTQKEKLDLMLNGSLDLAKVLLPILDDFDRAKKALEDSTEVEELKKGQDLIHQKLKSTLESKGLKPMESSIGKPFDTDFHEAITQLPSPNKDMKDKVMDEVETGYMFNDKVIRYAKVVVAK
ncbi:MAG: nucleotide exchange factor GrpE [Flavobacteriales bacterium]